MILSCLILIYKYKRGKLFSPFIFIGLFSSIAIAQFELSNWTHPGINFNHKITKNSVYVYSNDDIYFITDDDSTRIYNLNSGIGLQLEINQNIDFDLKIQHNKNRLRNHEELLYFDINQDYTELKSNITFKKNTKIQPSLILLMQKKYFAVGGGCNFNLTQDMSLYGKYFINKKYIDVKLSYDNNDFIFTPNTFIERQYTYEFGYKYNSNFLSLNLKNINNKYYVKDNTNIINRLKSPYHNDNANLIHLILKNKKKSEFIFGYNNADKDFSLYFIKNNNPFLKLTRVLFNSNQWNFMYRKNNANSSFGVGALYKKTNILIASKIKASSIGESLEEIFGGVFVNNRNEGDIIVNSLLMNYYKNINNHELKFYLSYNINKYDINMTNKVYYILLPFFADPDLSTSEQLDYEKSTSITFGFEDEIIFKKIILNIKFYQTIPLEFYRYSLDGLDDTSSGSKIAGYGLGKIFINLSVPLN